MASNVVTILGTGTMGQGIAQVAATSGFETRLFDTDASRAEKAIRGIAEQLDRMVSKGKLGADEAASAKARVSQATDVASASAGAGVVIEAVPESMELKVELFTRVIAHAPKDALLGSNTSSLSLTELGTRIGAAERTVGLHFFNPPELSEQLLALRGVNEHAETAN